MCVTPKSKLLIVYSQTSGTIYASVIIASILSSDAATSIGELIDQALPLHERSFIPPPVDAGRTQHAL